MGDTIAILDASVLFSASLRDLLMRLALSGLYRPKWTQRIHEEWIHAVLKRRPDISKERLARTSERMDAYILEALIEDYESLIPNLILSDPNDRHVLAAAIKGNASIIITYNLKDFPSEQLSTYQIEAQHPDRFISQLTTVYTSEVLGTMRKHRSMGLTLLTISSSKTLYSVEAISPLPI